MQTLILYVIMKEQLEDNGPVNAHLRIPGIYTYIPINLFDYYGHGQPILNLPSNRSRSSHGHNLYIHCSTLVHNSMCQVC